MSEKPPFNHELRDKIAAHVVDRPMPTFGGTSSSALSMQVAAKQNNLVVRRTKPQPVERARRRAETTLKPCDLPREPKWQDPALAKQAIQRFMLPREGQTREDRLTASMLWALGTIHPSNTKAQNIMAMTHVHEMEGLLSGAASRLYQPVGEPRDDKITARGWAPYGLAVVAGEHIYSSQPENERSYPKAMLKVVQAIEAVLPRGVQLDHLLPTGKSGHGENSSEEASARLLRQQRLADRLNDRRREIRRGDAPGLTTRLYQYGLAVSVEQYRGGYDGLIDSVAGMFLIGHDADDMRVKKTKLPTEE